MNRLFISFTMLCILSACVHSGKITPAAAGNNKDAATEYTCDVSESDVIDPASNDLLVIKFQYLAKDSSLLDAMEYYLREDFSFTGFENVFNYTPLPDKNILRHNPTFTPKTSHSFIGQTKRFKENEDNGYTLLVAPYYDFAKNSQAVLRLHRTARAFKMERAKCNYVALFLSDNQQEKSLKEIIERVGGNIKDVFIFNSKGLKQIKHAQTDEKFFKEIISTINEK